MHITTKRLCGYLGRNPDGMWQFGEHDLPLLLSFPLVKGGFFRRMVTAAPDYRIYLTSGIAGTSPHAVEFLGCRHREAEHSTSEDLLREREAAWMMRVIEFACSTEEEIGLGDTVDFGEPPTEGTQMCGVLLLPLLEDFGVKELTKKAKPAELVLNVMPISRIELEMKRTHGLEYLMDRFEEAGVFPVLDLERLSLARNEQM